MHTRDPIRTATRAMRRRTGVVIPVYFPDGSRPGDAAHYLEDTVCGLLDQLDDAADLCLSVDGPEHGKEVVEKLADTYGVTTVIGDCNRGKLQGVRNGMQELLDNDQLDFLAILDADGDHFPNELLNFVRAAQYTQASSDDQGVLVLGRRISLHHPMGFPRGELEILADRIQLEALRYHAAITGQPLRLQFALHLDDPPDFHSGYKLFSRTTAETLFLADPNPAGVDDDCYYRHAVEAVLTTEALLSGAALTCINRTTLNEQPTTTFGLLHRQQLVADKMIWTLKRLQVPPPFIAQWLHDHLPRQLLETLGEGHEELLEIRRLVCEACGVGTPDAPYPRPLFL